MSTSKENELAAVKLLQAEYQRGRLDGISQGYAAAQRILVWWADNHKLKEPHSVETLHEWSLRELKILQEAMKFFDSNK